MGTVSISHKLYSKEVLDMYITEKDTHKTLSNMNCLFGR